MKCNICGGELQAGDNVCKYCGNVMNISKSNESLEQTRKIEMPPRQHKKTDTEPQRERVYQQPKHDTNYCSRCGRPLDGVTHKCIVCDAQEVSRRAYVNEDYRNREINIMAQKKKKKKKTNIVRNTVLAILGMIVLFIVALIFAFKELPDWLGIGVTKDTEKSAVTVTSKPRNTADPNWKADVNDGKPAEEETEKPTEAPLRTPEPEPSGDPVDLRGGEYLYPSDTHVISEEELDAKSRQDIKLIYWEIYARHGYTFDDEMADYFENNHQWYMPTTSDKAKVESKFNSIEKRNITTIEAYQKKKGWRS